MITMTEEEIAHEFLKISKIGRDWIITLNGHIIWRGKSKLDANAVISVCFIPDVVAIVKKARQQA